MKKVKKHIISLIFILYVLNANSQYFHEPHNMEINFKELRELGKDAFFEKHAISQDSLYTITSVTIRNYLGDSVIITPHDFPHVNSIEFHQLKSDATDLKGLSKFTNLKTLKISFDKIGFNTNLNEIYTCVNLESLSIHHLFPVEISDSIKNLRNLKEFRISRLANPEVVCQLNNWQNIYEHYCIEEKAIDFVICCKMSGFTFDEVLAINSCVTSFEYNFNIDSSFTIYRSNGTKACTGMFKNGKRVGVWLYFLSYYNQEVKYTYSEIGKLLERETIDFNDDNQIKHKAIIRFHEKNTNTYFKFTRLNISYTYSNNAIIQDTTGRYITTQMLDTISNIKYFIGRESYSFIDFDKNIGYAFTLNNNAEIVPISARKINTGEFFTYEDYLHTLQRFGINICIDCFSSDTINQLMQRIPKFYELDDYFKH